MISIGGRREDSRNQCLEGIMRFHRCRLKAGALCVLAILVAGEPAKAQNYPAKPVRIITHGAPGSPPDLIARLIADRLTRSWSQQVLVLNQPGGGSSVAARVAASSAPDGYTLYMPATSAFAVLPGMAPNLPL